MIRTLAKHDVEQELFIARQEIRYLLEEIAHYKYFFDNSPMGIYRTTPDGRILHSNSTLADMLGYSSVDDLMSRNIESTEYYEGANRRTFKERVEREGEIKVSESVWSKKDGSLIHIRENARVVRDDNGKVMYYEGTVEDITELKKLDRAKDDFISTAAHELRTPLTVLEGYLALLEKDQVKLDPKQHNYVQKIGRAAGKLHEIVEDLLSVLRLEHQPASESLPFDIGPVLEETVNEWRVKAESENKELMLDDHHSYLVFGNPSRTKKIISNLVSNALKYTQPNGHIRVSARRAFDETGHVAMVSVEDNGVGIPKEHLNTVFQKFSRIQNELSVKAGGTGLGLYIVKQLVEIQKGRIWVDSEIGRGSKFTFTMPLREENQQLPLIK